MILNLILGAVVYIFIMASLIFIALCINYGIYSEFGQKYSFKEFIKIIFKIK